MASECFQMADRNETRADLPSGDGACGIGFPASDDARGAAAAEESRTTRREVVARPASASRWWLAVFWGVLVSVPLAWLLSYAAMLPFFLGLFFFVLFGLVIGAVMHRAASPGRPYGRITLAVGTAVVVVFTWIVSIAKESRDFPNDMASEAAERTRYIGDRPVHEWRTEVAAKVRTFLREQYPPGGVLGYVKWVLVSGELRRGQIEGVQRTLQRSQRRYSWAVRALLSVVCLGFGVGSQTFALAKLGDPAVRVIDERRGRAPL